MPGAEADTSSRGAPRRSAGGSGRHAATLKVGPEQDIRLRATATVKLGMLEYKNNRIMLKSRCTLDGQAYLDVGKLLLPSFEEHSGKTVTLDELPFVGKSWQSDIVEGDCDLWLTLRERIGRKQFQETLLASRCHRDGVWGDDGCASPPKFEETKPVTAESIDVRVLSFDARISRKGGHNLKLNVEYSVTHAVHADWDLEAEAVCTAGTETVTFANGVNGVDLFELHPGEAARGFLPPPYKVEQMLSSPLERCDLTVRASKSRGEELQSVGRFCLELGKDARTGACTPS